MNYYPNYLLSCISTIPTFPYFVSLINIREKYRITFINSKSDSTSIFLKIFISMNFYLHFFTISLTATTSNNMRNNIFLSISCFSFFSISSVFPFTKAFIFFSVIQPAPPPPAPLAFCSGVKCVIACWLSFAPKYSWYSLPLLASSFIFVAYSALLIPLCSERLSSCIR